MRDGHAQQPRVVDLLEGMLQGTDGKWHLVPPAIKTGVVLILDFAIADHVAVHQQVLHEGLTDSVVVGQIVPIRKMKQVNVPAARRMLQQQVL